MAVNIVPGAAYSHAFVSLGSLIPVRQGYALLAGGLREPVLGQVSACAVHLLLHTEKQPKQSILYIHQVLGLKPRAGGDACLWELHIFLSRPRIRLLPAKLSCQQALNHHPDYFDNWVHPNCLLLGHGGLRSSHGYEKQKTLDRC